MANNTPGGIEEATAGYNPAFKVSSLDMLYWSQGLFSFVAKLDPLIEALKPLSPPTQRTDADSPPQTPPGWDGDLRIPSLQASYKAGVSPVAVVEAMYNKIEAYEKINPGPWIHLYPKDKALAAAEALAQQYPDRSQLPPLFGVPFSVKDSIDVAGIPTTTACPPLAHIPSISSPAYDRVIEQGALFFGKTNLDQLATGLTGCRSPYGLSHSVFHEEYISGGSSSGNCVTVGAGLVSFSLATDTAGSGRVPSLFNGVIGYKPTRGVIPFVGVTPACLSLDCIAIISKTVSDARTVWQLVEEFDPRDRYAKQVPGFERHVNSIGPQSKSFTFGIPPPEALNICAPVFRRLFNEAVTKLQAIGGKLVPLDWSPFEKAGLLLYNGTFVSERLASLPDNWFENNRRFLHPVIVKLFEDVIARNSSAVQAYRDLQDKALYTRQAEQVYAQGVDVVIVPTAPTHWTIKEVLDDPIRKNSILGEFTHFGNVLDLCCVAVPAGTYPAGELSGKEDTKPLPFGVTFLGCSRTDAEVLEIASRFEESQLSF